MTRASKTACGAGHLPSFFLFFIRQQLVTFYFILRKKEMSILHENKNDKKIFIMRAKKMALKKGQKMKADALNKI